MKRSIIKIDNKLYYFNNMDNYHCKKYLCDINSVKDKLKKYGVAVIPNILDSNECKQMEKGMWETLEYLSKDWESPIKKNDDTSWKNIKHLYPKHGMLIQNFRIGHSQFIWDLRQKEKLLNIFSEIWDCENKDLLTSFDAASFHLPSEITNIGWHRNDWFHTDQSFTRNGFECIQSWVTGFDVNKGDATLGFYEKSHKYHKEFQEKFKIDDKSDWYKLTDDQTTFYKNKGCKKRKIYCPKGSMVLWDSRTIHCGVGPIKQRNKLNFRCVVYLCYTPRILASKSIIKKRIKAFEEVRMTSHWPHKPKLFPKNPRTYGGELKQVSIINKPTINNLGKKLVGYN